MTLVKAALPLVLIAAAAVARGDENPCPLHAAHAQAAPARPAPATPYAGQQARTVTSLSAEEVAGYLEGRGMGLARPAELHHYPGPRHVLDLADELQLSEAQVAATQKAYEQMRAEAVPRGEQLVAAERRLDEAFAAGDLDEAGLAALVEDAARAQGALRAAHLKAHLALHGLLTPEQIARYDALRGYGADVPAAP
jgi:Spy/CpxP family protein refolding chaperone